MIERLLIAIILVAVGAAAYHLLTQRQLGRANQHAPADPLLADAPSGRPVIVYFTTPTCAPCRLQQTPTLQRLQQELGERLHVVRVDATQQPDAAQRWGVFSVPTTFVLDQHGRARGVHNGIVDSETLKRELLA